MGRGRPPSNLKTETTNNLDASLSERIIQESSSETSNSPTMDSSAIQRRRGRPPKASSLIDVEDSSSVQITASNSSNDSFGSSSRPLTVLVKTKPFAPPPPPAQTILETMDCRRSSRKKVPKFDVRDLLNKRSHKIQIIDRIDSNTPAPKIEIAKKPTIVPEPIVIQQSPDPFRRFSMCKDRRSIETMDISADKIHCRRLSRTQEIFNACLLESQKVESLIQENLDTRKSIEMERQKSISLENFKNAREDVRDDSKPKRRGRPPKKPKPVPVAHSENSVIDLDEIDSCDTSETTTTTTTVAQSEDSIECITISEDTNSNSYQTRLGEIINDWTEVENEVEVASSMKVKVQVERLNLEVNNKVVENPKRSSFDLSFPKISVKGSSPGEGSSKASVEASITDKPKPSRIIKEPTHAYVSLEIMPDYPPDCLSSPDFKAYEAKKDTDSLSKRIVTLPKKRTSNAARKSPSDESSESSEISINMSARRRQRTSNVQCAVSTTTTPSESTSDESLGGKESAMQTKTDDPGVTSNSVAELPVQEDNTKTNDTVQEHPFPKALNSNSILVSSDDSNSSDSKKSSEGFHPPSGFIMESSQVSPKKCVDKQRRSLATTAAQYNRSDSPSESVPRRGRPPKKTKVNQEQVPLEVESNKQEAASESRSAIEESASVETCTNVGNDIARNTLEKSEKGPSDVLEPDNAPPTTEIPEESGRNAESVNDNVSKMENEPEIASISPPSTAKSDEKDDRVSDDVSKPEKEGVLEDRDSKKGEKVNDDASKLGNKLSNVSRSSSTTAEFNLETTSVDGSKEEVQDEKEFVQKCGEIDKEKAEKDSIINPKNATETISHPTIVHSDTSPLRSSSTSQKSATEDKKSSKQEDSSVEKHSKRISKENDSPLPSNSRGEDKDRKKEDPELRKESKGIETIESKISRKNSTLSGTTRNSLDTDDSRKSSGHRKSSSSSSSTHRSSLPKSSSSASSHRKAEDKESPAGKSKEKFKIPKADESLSSSPSASEAHKKDHRSSPLIKLDKQKSRRSSSLQSSPKCDSKSERKERKEEKPCADRSKRPSDTKKVPTNETKPSDVIQACSKPQSDSKTEISSKPSEKVEKDPKKPSTKDPARKVDSFAANLKKMPTSSSAAVQQQRDKELEDKSKMKKSSLSVKPFKTFSSALGEKKKVETRFISPASIISEIYDISRLAKMPPSLAGSSFLAKEKAKDKEDLAKSEKERVEKSQNDGIEKKDEKEVKNDNEKVEKSVNVLEKGSESLESGSEKRGPTTPPLPSEDVKKEPSPPTADLNDPLKDIEKFIEAGVNLLKHRSLSSDEDEDPTAPRNVGTARFGRFVGDDQPTAETVADQESLKRKILSVVFDDVLIDESSKPGSPKRVKGNEENWEESLKDPLKEDSLPSENKEIIKSEEIADDPKTLKKQRDRQILEEIKSSLIVKKSDDDTTNSSVRRSHRIKTITKPKSLVGRGLVKEEERNFNYFAERRPKLEQIEAENARFLQGIDHRSSQFKAIRDNDYKCDRDISKEAKRMLCDCFLTPEEEERGEFGCGEDCLNRLLMIECGPDCVVGERCTNQRFQKHSYSPCRVFRTDKKGFGIMADTEILPGSFIMEYVGEVINTSEFEKRREEYSKISNEHYYFMALRSDAIIDATAKGSISRFINHSCDPNAETQKWTVNGELRIGFFSTKHIMPGEEITFDYQFQRYGKEAQRCWCEASNCRGWIGKEPNSDEEEEEDEDEEDEDDYDEEEEIEDEKPAIEPIPIAATDDKSDQTAVEPTLKPDEKPERPKKPRKKIKIPKKPKRLAEPDPFREDAEVENEIHSLIRSGLQNQNQTLLFSRVMVRSKLVSTRLKLLEILIAGHHACRRLFIDYHGLRLLHGWMNDVSDLDRKYSEADDQVRSALLRTLDALPLTNRTSLMDSKVYQIVQKWAGENSSSLSPPSEESSNSNEPLEQTPTAPKTESEESRKEIQELSKKLLGIWNNLPIFGRIPKKERIEQMKEHEREANREYQTLENDDYNTSSSRFSRDSSRYSKSSTSSSYNPARTSGNSKFKWSKDKPETTDGNWNKFYREFEKTNSQTSASFSKNHFRQMFAAKFEKDVEEKRLAEERREFEIKCRFFGYDPKLVNPRNVPFCVDPSTSQWYTEDQRKIPTPPSQAFSQFMKKPLSTNPKDYKLPTCATKLPQMWKVAIDPRGRIYYYHVKYRIPQWEPPTEDLQDGLKGMSCGSAGSNSGDSSSEEEYKNTDFALSDDDQEILALDADPVKLAAFIEKKLEKIDVKRFTKLVSIVPISPRKEEDRIYNQIEMRKYKENKEKIRRRKEEIRRRRAIAESAKSSTVTTEVVDGDDVRIHDYLLSSEDDDEAASEEIPIEGKSPLIDKIVEGETIVDELDALKSAKALKRRLPIKENPDSKKRPKVTTEKKEASVISGSSNKSKRKEIEKQQRKAKEKFRVEIAGIIVQHLTPYQREDCVKGRITSTDDFRHLARKLTHFVLVKELKYCETIGQPLVVTESVKNKSREFIKKYMAKYDEVYRRPQNDPEFKEIPH